MTTCACLERLSPGCDVSSRRTPLSRPASRRSPRPTSVAPLWTMRARARPAPAADEPLPAPGKPFFWHQDGEPATAALFRRFPAPPAASRSRIPPQFPPGAHHPSPRAAAALPVHAVRRKLPAACSRQQACGCCAPGARSRLLLGPRADHPQAQRRRGETRSRPGRGHVRVATPPAHVAIHDFNA